MLVSLNTAVFLDKLTQGQPQIACLREVTTWPLANVEVRGEFFKPATKTQELAELQALAQANHWGLYYSVPNELFANGQLCPTFEADLALAEKYQFKNLKYSLGRPEKVRALDLVRLATILTQTKVTVTIENQPTPAGKLINVQRFLDRCADLQLNLGYTFDAGNWYWCEQTPEEAFRQLRDQITIFHLKDIQAKQTVLLGKGQTDWEPLVSALPKGVPVFLEYATPDLRTLRSEIERVQHLLLK